jgi:hypothetical protein
MNGLFVSAHIPVQGVGQEDPLCPRLGGHRVDVGVFDEEEAAVGEEGGCAWTSGGKRLLAPSKKAARGRCDGVAVPAGEHEPQRSKR